MTDRDRQQEQNETDRENPIGAADEEFDETDDDGDDSEDQDEFDEEKPGSDTRNQDVIRSDMDGTGSDREPSRPADEDPSIDRPSER